ncbi:MAG: methyltransferase domain-containing protein, partial [Pseudomonadota bacterium]
GAQVMALDIAFPMLRRARANASWWQRLLSEDASRLCADAEALPLATESVDMLVSNLTLQWCDPVRAFAEFRRVLRPGGVLMFTTFGPDTLTELRAAWRAVDASLHVHPFLDMHDIGDALVRAGLAEPVMDVERVTLTYADPVDVMRDIKSIGAHNAVYGRARGLTGKQHFAGMRAAYRQWENADGRVPATYEVVFGHAWAPGGAGRLGVPPQDTAIKVPIVEVRRTPPHR